MNKLTQLAAIAIAAVAGTAQATVFVEQEPNDTLETAQVLIHDGTIDLLGFRESSPTNDFNDFFSFDATAGDDLELRVTALPPGGDPVLRLYDDLGNILAENDDDGDGLNSLINFNVSVTGTYFAGIRGFADSVYEYQFTVTGLTPSAAVVPEPASWAMMIAGFGLVGGAMRRRTTSVAFA